MDILELLDLVIKASEGIDHIEEGAVGSNGYGFVFRDPFNSKESFIVTIESSKFCTVSFHRKIKTPWHFLRDRKEDLVKFLIQEDKSDILLAGSLKTLIPNLKFGRDLGEILFDSWVFIRTPNDKRFPASFYYGQSGFALGGWDSYIDELGNDIFPNDFSSEINFNPFDFSRKELDELIYALEFALRKVPVSDFYGVLRHDLGDSFIGVKFGRPFSIELDFQYNDDDLEMMFSALM
ncbi:MAG: hypothetical protein ACFFB0_03560 [Promethearchaeota archaeon]